MVAQAPGRINLLGEHTDYNHGYALPMALSQQTTVRFDTDGSESVSLWSSEAGAGETFRLSVVPGDVEGWSAYPAGAVWSLAESGYRVVGGTMTVSSDVPIGAGLSSSAALECAVLLAMNAATRTQVGRLEVACIALRGENEFVGAPTGLLDQLASLNGAAGHALLIDFDTLAVTPVRFDLDACGLSLLVIDSHAAHRHSTGEYAARRASCARGARDLGIDSLRNVQGMDIEQILGRVVGATDRRRVRHVLTENQRVLECASALATGDFHTVGTLMNTSHESMRDDFEITTPHIDLITESVVRRGALGARMTGGGFGGSVIALVPAGDAAAVADGVAADVRRAGYPTPTSFVARPGPGATATPVSG